MGIERSHVSSGHRSVSGYGDRKKKQKITDDEIAEYLVRKSCKKAMKVAKKLKSQTVSGYANESNPFGDSNLNEKFVWRKKIERDVTQGVPLEIFSVKQEKRKYRERMEDIEKVKKRREEKAFEKEQREEQMALLAKERARAEFQDWEKKEEEFNFHQSKARSEIRLREGRTKPIDILSKHLDASDGFDIKVEPYLVFQGLTIKVMEELHQDIKMHLNLDRAAPTHIQYWEALLVVCDWQLAEARKQEASNRARVYGEQPPAEDRSLHWSIESDVKNLLEGKTYSELEVLQSEIESQMRSGTAKVVEYWEVILKHIHIYKAKAFLKELHAEMVRDYRSSTPEEVDHQEVDTGFDEKNDQPVETVEAGSYSPELLHGEEAEEAIDSEEDKAILERKRVAVLEEQQRLVREALALRPVQSTKDNFEMNAMKSMGATEEGDAVFGNNVNDEIKLDSQVYWWQDKYRPRKPKYLNRVHTGYGWNKYNQTHYDHDNPPPKTVQGYKFNVFYPDLFYKGKTPSYTIEKDGDSSETCIIRFHAGPPYEDIAFRILNKEWEYSHKKGFKCIFERGILQLYFNFKHHGYRR